METLKYILEQIVSFETAKLAKEKGLTYSEVGMSYRPNGEITYGKNDETFYPAPSQSQLQRWLREKYNTHVNPVDYELPQTKVIMYELSSETNNNSCERLKEALKTKVESKFGLYDTYEEALEIGLQKALK